VVYNYVTTDRVIRIESYRVSLIDLV